MKHMFNPLSVTVACCAIIALDSLWFGLLSQNVYSSEIGSLFKYTNGKVEMNYWYIAIVYTALISGILYFVNPSKLNGLDAFKKGSFFGLVVYSVYNFTNLAIIKDWTFKISCIDTMWGTFVCGIISLIICFFK